LSDELAQLATAFGAFIAMSKKALVRYQGTPIKRLPDRTTP
jgi:hypothetical protein